MSDVGCRMSDVGCRMSDVRCQMSDVMCRMSNSRTEPYHKMSPKGRTEPILNVYQAKNNHENDGTYHPLLRRSSQTYKNTNNQHFETENKLKNFIGVGK